MKLKKYIFGVAALALLGGMVSSCNDDDFTDTIFPDVSTTPDPGAATYKFDTWLNKNFRDIYNLKFAYRLDDNETDFDYTLTPASLDNSRKMAVLTKYIWYDAYAEAYGSPEFIRRTGPKMICLIGSVMYNEDGTTTYGYATGGVQITLTGINNAVFDHNHMDDLNNLYFHTMHHEFTHILHQTKNYPVEFNAISIGRYDGNNWGKKNGGLMASLGFVTPYAGSSYTEDFAETVSNWITRTDEDYEMVNWAAERGWYTGEDELSQKDAFCYYFFQYNDAHEMTEKKAYFMKYNSTPFNTDVYISDGNDTSVKKVFRTPEACEEYILEKNENLRIAFKDQESQRLYGDGVKYRHLTAEQKAVVDQAAEGRTFVYPVEDNDKINGRELMEQKLNIARNWFRDAWGLDLDKLRTIVQRRSSDFDIDALLREIDDIPVPGQQ